jgi:flagellin
MKMAQRNANDAVAMLRTAEGAYVTLSDILIRMRELAIQAGNDTLTDTERGFLDTEFQQLVGEIDRIAQVTEYNGVGLLDGTAGTAGEVVFQVGMRDTADDRITTQLNSLDTTTLKVDNIKIETLGDAQTSLANIDSALNDISTARASLGATMNQITWAMDNLGIGIENLSSAQSQIRDVDISSESATFAGSQVLMQAGVSMLAQANGIPNLAVQLLQG